MRIVYVDEDGERDAELRFGRPDATLGDLAVALGLPGRVLAVDGRLLPEDTVLGESGLLNGSRVAGTARPGALGLRRPGAVLRVVGGLEAGREVPLAAGRTVAGRGREAGLRVDATGVSRRHAVFELLPGGRVTVTDAGSANGTDVNGARIGGQAAVGPDDLVCLGGEVLVRALPSGPPGTVQSFDPVRQAGSAGTLPFNRVPRGGLTPEPAPLGVPEPPPRRDRTPFSVSAMVGPLLLAAATVVLTGDPRFAALAALTPLMFLGNFVEERVRGRAGGKRGRRDYAARLAGFAKAVDERRTAEAGRRRSAVPDPAEVVFRATAPCVTLWERRPGAEDFLRLAVGWADLPWTPPLADGRAGPAAEPAAILAGRAVLPQVPVVVTVGAGRAVGFEGERAASLAVARSLLCQAVVGSGPADVTVALFTDADRLADWDWTKWLPHGADPGPGAARLVAVGTEQSDVLARRLLTAGPADAEPGPARAADGTGRAGPVTLVVVDGAALLEGRPCPLRELIAGGAVRCGALVLTTRLPALCTTVVTASAPGGGRVRDVASGEVVAGVLLNGMPVPQARETARALARFEDPELGLPGAGLPDRVSLLPLLGLERVDGAAVAGRWRRRAPALRVRAVLGVTERDVFAVDLDDDGPHALIAGTTGSGKSELLRTLVAGMAVDADPEHLTFALVDYKGGGALDECAALPHAVGLVTDLDEQLGERALRCLEAELRHRERLLRDTGLSHVRDYQRLRDSGRPELEPMPRLVVVIDEFATLVKALPDFVDSLVGIAQRGRSLGVHLVMATQRPAGSVSDAIKNNVKLRIALRLESVADSQDVIDDPAAATIGTRQWGRAYYRLSAREVLPVQTALSTGVTAAAGATAPVTAVPFVLGPPAAGQEEADPDGTTDLQLLVAAARDAAARSGFAPPRRPWPDPLPPVVPAAGLPPTAERGLQTDAADLPAYALADDPDQQRQYPVGWDPAAGNLAVYGAGGAGTSTALAALALAAAAAAPPNRCQLFVLDLGKGALRPLTGLPHTGAHVGPAERERQIRLIRLLRRELDTRKGSGMSAAPDWLVLVDGLGALLSDFDKDIAGMNLVDDLARVYADGPAVGIRFAVTADRSGAVPSSWAALTQQKLLMRLADAGEYGYFDVPRAAVPGYVPGRALVAATRQVIQIAWPGDDLAAAVAAVAALRPGAARTAPGVGLLPTDLALTGLDAPASAGAEPWSLPLGLDDRTLHPVGLRLYEGDHALVAGPQRSGRSTALCTLARIAAAAADPPAVVAFAPRRSPLREMPGLTALVTDYAELAPALAQRSGPVLLLADDADTVPDELGVLGRWLAEAGPGAHLVAAGRSDALRRLYGHWTQVPRDSRCGVLLCPDHDLDGELLGTTLPRLDRMAALPGRGYLVVDGVAGGVQLAR
ncbi:FtsK/SpoIIIE domain-containing protein [Streptomyces sp. NPDC020983]|uniref:FtsK/SpoIIIE domain-containing protein n=1 Tax=Streptomyces sp. NPDC020983 TaxID=3365106 RepID=UPI0037B2E009